MPNVRSPRSSFAPEHTAQPGACNSGGSWPELHGRRNPLHSFTRAGCIDHLISYLRVQGRMPSGRSGLASSECCIGLRAYCSRELFSPFRRYVVRSQGRSEGRRDGPWEGRQNGTTWTGSRTRACSAPADPVKRTQERARGVILFGSFWCKTAAGSTSGLLFVTRGGQES